MRRTFALLAVALLATACTQVVPASPERQLQGTSWVAASIGGKTVVGSQRPTLEFGKDSTASGSDGCNRFTGSYTGSGEKLSFGQLASTAMACVDEAVTEQATRFLAALGATAGTRNSGATLDLLDASGAVLASFQAAPAVDPVALLGTTWTLTGIVSGEAVASPVADSTVTLVLADGSLSGKACNTFRGSLELDGGRMAVGPLMATKMSCGADLDAQEASVLGILGKATTLTQAVNTLTLTAPDGSALQFKAA
jgi:heat shock protein HslJ